MSAWRGEIVGHRGAAGVAPENTLASFEAALAAGAASVELDVRATIDGHAIVFHDATVDRFEPGTRDGAVSRRSLLQMKGLDVGASLGRPGCFVPSLDETLRALRGRAFVHVEVKGAGPGGFLALRLAIETIRRLRMGGDVVLSSFPVAVLRRARAEASEIPRALIVDSRAAAWGVEGAAGCGCEGLHALHSLVNAGMIARCRAAGLSLRAWTADERADVERLMTIGVDGIVSDFPGLVRELRDTMAAP